MIRASLCLLLAAAPAFAELPYVVDRADIVQQVRERGVVEAVKAADVIAPSLSLPPGKSLTIRWLIEDGTMVKKGDKLVEFDNEFLREAMLQQRFNVEQAAAALTAAQQEGKLADLQNQRESRGVKAALEIAELVLKNSTESEALSKRRQVLKVKQAEVAVERARAALKNESDEAKLGLHSAQIERELAEIELRQFELNAATARKQLESRLEEARADIELANLRAQQRSAQAEAQLSAHKAALAQEKAKFDSLNAEMARTVMSAPLDGMVVYSTPEDVRYRGPVTMVGETMTAGYRVLQVVELTEFKVVTRVPEANVSALRPGLAAHVRIDAFPDRAIEGKVGEVSPVPARGSWQRQDVKVYPVSITLTKDGLGLKPGMSSEVNIHIATAKNALRVPVKSVIRSGRKTVCAVDGPDGVREAAVTLGISDGNFVEIKSGLKEGDKVLIPMKP